jgi:hypothetical protein
MMGKNGTSWGGKERGMDWHITSRLCFLFEGAVGVGVAVMISDGACE